MKKYFSVSAISCLTAALFSSALCASRGWAEESPSVDGGANVQLSATPEQSKLTAVRVTYDGGKIAAEGTPDNPVQYKNGNVIVTAQKVLLDTIGQTITADGSVVVVRQLDTMKAKLTPSRLPPTYENQTQTETLRGTHFFYNYQNQQGSLDDVYLRLANFTLSATHLTVNGHRYVATDVIVRPGGLTAAERKIYGTPPLNLRAREVTVDNNTLAPADAAADQATDAKPRHELSLTAKHAGLYFKNTKIMPVPNYILRQTASSGNRDTRAFSITPRLSFGSEDGVMATTQLQYIFNQDKPQDLFAVADLGLSLRQGFRGGVGINKDTRLGEFNANVHVKDIVSNQIDDRVRLNRVPEVNYRSPDITFFNLPGDRKAGVILGASWGKYREVSIDSGGEVRSDRRQILAKFTTRLANPRGLYAELTARHANYSNFVRHYDTVGFEVGYFGNITHYIDGQFSYSNTRVSGATPFIFDNVEIRRELRATFDILPMPRYIIPIDIRYDLEQNRVRDKSFGILRNYKTFAYGFTYNSAHRQLSFEFRRGF